MHRGLLDLTLKVLNCTPLEATDWETADKSHVTISHGSLIRKVASLKANWVSRPLALIPHGVGDLAALAGSSQLVTP